MNKTELVGLLKTNIANVTFIKADGSRREMRCTLREDLLPPAVTNTTQVVGDKKTRTDDLVIAYDLDKRGWRTFNIDRVENVEYD